MHRASLFALLLTVLCSLPALGGNVYKWTDEQGVTHFGSIPPAPTQPIKEKVQKIQADNSSPASATAGFNGQWWGRMEGRTISLLLNHGKFTLLTPAALHSGNDSHLLASGRYRTSPGELVLTYYVNHALPEMLDKDEVFEIRDSDEKHLQLIRNKIEDITLRKLLRADPTPFSREIKGEWSNENDRMTLYRFDHGTVEILFAKEYSTRPRAMANWEWLDPELILEYVVDLESPEGRLNGKSLRWNLRQKESNKLLFVNVATGERITLIRKYD